MIFVILERTPDQCSCLPAILLRFFGLILASLALPAIVYCPDFLFISRENLAMLTMGCVPVLLLTQCRAVERQLALGAAGELHSVAIIAPHAVVASV